MLLSPFNHRLTAVLALIFAAGAAAAEQRASQPLKHRDRAVTESDYQRLAPQSPGADVHRAAPPKPMTAPESKSKALSPPAIDDRKYEQIRDDLIKKKPAHTPEWTDHNDSGPGAAGLDPQSGGVKFGDGASGRRPPSGGPLPKPKRRHGQGGSGNLPARPGPVTFPYPNAAAPSKTGVDDSPGDDD